jgi:ubiquinol-cytochrome c reductase cytochrome b subunit
MMDTNLVASVKFFGGTKFKDGKMVRFVRRHIGEFGAAEKAQLQKVVMALSAEAGLKSQREADARDSALIAEGRQSLVSEGMRCTECHQFGKEGSEPSAPDLTGYGSREWLIDFILNPAHERFYDKRNDRMPLYGPDKVLDRKSVELIADWLRGDWYEPPPAQVGSVAAGTPR